MQNHIDDLFNTPEPAPTTAYGKVTDTSPLTVQFNGTAATDAVSGFLSTVSPAVGDLVMVQKVGPSWVVTGIIGGSATWHEIGDPGEPAFQSPWVNTGSGYETCAFRKLPGGLVVMRGLAQSTSGSTSGTVFTLPAGYRPGGTAWHSFTGYNGSSYIAVRLDINASGDVTVSSATPTVYATFAALSFYAEQ